jgi:hypothetical protein
MRKAIMDSLRADELVAYTEFKSPSGRGKPRLAWIATQPEADDEAA